MAYFSPMSNAVAWAQFRLRGGWRNIAMTIGAYGTIVVGLIFLTLRLNLDKTSDMLFGWTMILLALQLGALFLVAGSGVRSSFRRDIEGGMIESHRLMPMSGVPAILGYLIGSTSQAMIGAAVTFLIGAVTTAAAGYNVFDWVVANGILLLYAVLCWIGIALLSVLSKSAFSLAMVVVILGCAIGGLMPMMLPGLVLLSGPMIRQTVFGIVERGLSWGPEYLLSFFAQVAIGGLLFIAAARRFRRDDVPAFGTLLGSALVLAWALLNIEGILTWDQIRPSMMWSASSLRTSQIICCTVSTLLVALVPLSNAAWGELAWRRRKLLNDPALGPKPIWPSVVAIVCAIIATLIPLTTLPPDQVRGDVLVSIGISATATLLTLRYLMGAINSRGRSPLWVTAGWILLGWFGPLMLDSAFMQIGPYHEFSGQFTFISAFGPPGVLIAAVETYHINVVPGLMFQCAVAIGMGALYRLATANYRSQASAAAG